MPITVNIYYKGDGNNAKKFAQEMTALGLVEQIRAEKGNLKYQYFVPLDDPQTILLVDSWESQEALDAHHNSHIMEQISTLRQKYDLHMTVQRFNCTEAIPVADLKFIKN